MSGAALPWGTSEAGFPETLPLLASEEQRARLSPVAVEAFGRIAAFWRLERAESLALLGGLEAEDWRRYREGAVLSQDLITRISLVVGIFKGLRMLFALPLADEWPKRPHAAPPFHGRTPLEVILAGGIPLLIEVRRHIDTVRAGF